MTQDAEVAGPQSEAAVVSEPPPTTAPRVLDPAQRTLLDAVLNRLIPPSATLPGAGDLGVGDSIEHTLSESPRLRRLVLDGLTAIRTTSQVSFVDLDPAAQTAHLQRVEQAHPAFFAALLDHTYRGYYTRPEVQQAVGFPARPPQPVGHTLPPFDPELLVHQRTRHPFWRPT